MLCYGCRRMTTWTRAGDYNVCDACDQPADVGPQTAVDFPGGGTGVGKKRSSAAIQAAVCDAPAADHAGLHAVVANYLSQNGTRATAPAAVRARDAIEASELAAPSRTPEARLRYVFSLVGRNVRDDDVKRALAHLARLRDFGDCRATKEITEHTWQIAAVALAVDGLLHPPEPDVPGGDLKLKEKAVEYAKQSSLPMPLELSNAVAAVWLSGLCRKVARM